MTHQRQLIREAAAALLVDQGPWQDRIYRNRMRPLSQLPGQRSARSKLPALVIYTRNEQAEVFNVAPRTYRCTVELVFEYIADDSDTLDDQLDDGAEIIERIIGRNDTLSGTANDSEYSSSQLAFSDQGERNLGSIILTFAVEYDREAPDGDFNDTLDDFDKLETQYSLNNQQDDPADRAKTFIEDLNP